MMGLPVLLSPTWTVVAMVAGIALIFLFNRQEKRNRANMQLSLVPYRTLAILTSFIVVIFAVNLFTYLLAMLHA